MKKIVMFVALLFATSVVVNANTITKKTSTSKEVKFIKVPKKITKPLVKTTEAKKPLTKLKK